MELFTEIFPLTPSATPRLYAYALSFNPAPDDAARVTRILARKLAGLATDGAQWLWVDGQLLSTDEREYTELNIALDLFRTADPRAFGMVAEIVPQGEIDPDPRRVADFVARTAFKRLEPAFEAALKPFNSTLNAPTGTVHVVREVNVRPWAVDGVPAVSLTITTRLSYEHTLQLFAETLPDPRKALIGLRVRDRLNGRVGDVAQISGRIHDRRAKLLQRRNLPDSLARALEQAAGSGWVVRVKMGGKRQEIPAFALEPLIRPSDFALFQLDPRTANQALRPAPDQRAKMVKALSDIAKSHSLIDKAYNTREHPARFEHIAPEPYLRWGNKRTRPYQPERLPFDLLQCGAFHLRALYHHDPIEICVVNAVSTPLEDFVEALQRQLARGFNFSINVLKERRVRVVSHANLESAVRVVEKSAPDMILAFLPSADEHPAEDDPDAPNAQDLPAYLKSLTLGRGIPTHVLFKHTLDDPDSMPQIIMAILARTGNTPFALADPLENVDYVVGLHVIRDSRNQRLTGIARVYRADGVFVRYAVRSVPMSDARMQVVFLRDLFPQKDFAGQRVVIHHEGIISDDIRQTLTLWGQAINARFMLVELIRRGAPRLYGLNKGQITAPPAGSAFIFSPTQACIVLNTPPDQPTPQPAQVHAHGLGIEPALRSLRLWMTLTYDAQNPPDLPVTLQNAGELAYWLNKGGTFTEAEGEVPFWL